MSVALHTPSRASAESSASNQPISRQNTMSSYDGSRSARQSKRYSMSALYLSIANEADLEIEDELAKGLFPRAQCIDGSWTLRAPTTPCGSKDGPSLTLPALQRKRICAN